MTKSVRLLALCCLTCLVIGSTSLARPKRHSTPVWGVAEVFSDLVLEPETGDVGGMEVILIKSYSQEFVAVVMASGVADDPVLVPVSRTGATFEFTLPADRYADYGTFTGKISRAGLTLWNGGKRFAFLRRQCL